MISSVFSKTKPVNHILVLSTLGVVFFLEAVFRRESGITLDNLPSVLLTLACLLFSVLAINFIVSRNQLTAPHSFTLYFFALLVLLFPDSLADSAAIIANLLLLFGMRRLVSMRSLRDIKSKIFDGTFWFLGASLLVDWTLLFLLLPWLYVYLYDPRNIRNWLVPLAAVLLTGLLVAAWISVSGDTGLFARNYRLAWEGTAAYWTDWDHTLRIGIYLAVILLSGLVAFLRLGKSGHGRIVSMRLLAISFLLGLGVVALRGGDAGNPILITFFPAAVFLSKYIETIRKDNWREGILAAFLLIAAGSYALSWVTQ